MNGKQNNNNTISRREFLLHFGVGTSLAIAGFFLLDTGRETNVESDKNTVDKPRLIDGITKVTENDQVILCKNNSKCIVNSTGEKIIDLLDGNNTLSSVCEKISDYYSIEYTDVLETSVASFICQLGESGFLSSPFYVLMYETT